MLCWYNAFGEPPQRDLQKHDVIFTEVDFLKENLVRIFLCVDFGFHVLILLFFVSLLFNCFNKVVTAYN